MNNDQRGQMLVETAAGEPHAPLAVIELPVGWEHKNEDGSVERWTRATVRELTGAEEDILNTNSIPPNVRLSMMVANCLQQLGPETDPRALKALVPKLQSADRIMLLFGVRRASLGDQYPLEMMCPNSQCVGEDGKRTHTLYTVDLSTVETVSPTVLAATKAVELPTPRKEVVVVRALTGVQEDIIARFDAIPPGTLSLVARIVSFNGTPWNLSGTMGFKAMKEYADRITALSWNAREAIREAAASLEGGVDTSVELQCPECGRQFKTELEVQSSFFSRSATRKRSNARSST